MSSGQALQALVFGASGVSGYAILKELLKYPAPNTFSRIIGLTNRGLNREIAQLPEDHRIELYSDLDLTQRNQTLLHLQHIPGIDKTTHVFFTAYTGHGKPYKELKQINTEILTNALGTCEIVCPEMKFFTLQTGGKAYGVEFVSEGVPYNPPLREDMPRVPEPWKENIFYYEQYDIMKRASNGKPWTFCEIRPDAIVGFVPQNNAMNIAQAAGIFLSLYQEVEGNNAEVPFPGSNDAWEALHTDTSQDMLARFHIYASLNPDKVSERAFNVVDGPATNWKEVWPEICSYFGLKGTGPKDNFDVTKWMKDHESESSSLRSKNGLREGAMEATSFDFMQGVTSIPFRRDYDPGASRSVGFTEERKHAEGYRMAFDEMRKARIIP